MLVILCILMYFVIGKKFELFFLFFIVFGMMFVNLLFLFLLSYEKGGFIYYFY